MQYFGQTCRALQKRFGEHYRRMKKPKPIDTFLYQHFKRTGHSPNDVLPVFILFAASAFRKLSSIYVFSYFPFGFEGGIWDPVVSVPDHCLSFYFDDY